MWEFLGAALAGGDAAPIPQTFMGGDTNWAGTWSVATSGSKASASSSPSAGLDAWVVPLAVVAGLVLIAMTVKGHK